LSSQLTEFRQKRVAGLGALFGASDIELEESITDKAKESAIIEGRIMPHIETIL
jgi:Regulator of G protein signalling-like domain